MDTKTLTFGESVVVLKNFDELPGDIRVKLPT
jgi:hypothetical protein